MAVMVDDLHRPGKLGWYDVTYCRLFGDDPVELEALAEDLIGPSCWKWFRAEPRPHYEVTAGCRQRAIKKGATPVPAAEFEARVLEAA